MSKQSMPPMSLELGHYRWCHTGYSYTHHSQAVSWLYGTIRYQEQGNPSDVKLGCIKKRKKIQTTPSPRVTRFHVARFPLTRKSELVSPDPTNAIFEVNPQLTPKSLKDNLKKK